eukprot:CAMPEP_0176397566 /NCGR_PEP_ID=MMETSP0126-20121128/45231_1 /TAXON_ID=141414 ORGANISM="Strombidinopsis acuminatum, Strain SPMC142" /NCGR_SAMPLE_ID=MMETSP0126 /ASSEMBLY_ACC=CAM_ASM_000229 /LENGTH=52 /DNA_ID=CAMNT_0017771961 /DNA_START=637 /DNA_END=795 /DNA_ORIENTATION=-
MMDYGKEGMHSHKDTYGDLKKTVLAMNKAADSAMEGLAPLQKDFVYNKGASY